MSNYKVQVDNSCLNFLKGLEKYNNSLHSQICDTIKEICSNPFKSKYKKLEESERDFRARSGNYRIVYFVSNGTVFITKIGQRKNVYKMPPGCPKLSKKKLMSLH